MPEAAEVDPRAAHYARVALAIDYLRLHAARQPALADVAAAAGLSEHHFQRVFAEWAGVSPKRFLQHLTKEHARASLRGAADVLGAALDAGLSGPGRLHDLMVSCEAMTPGEIRSRGAGVELAYGCAGTPFGTALIGWTPRGVCHFAFCDGDDEARIAELHAEWPLALRRADPAGAAALAARVFPRVPGRGELHVVLRGTNFQIKVWEALLRTAPGERVSYSRLAAMAGAPAAQRAVGSALAANAVAWLIPCHRVIRGSGETGQYRWGPSRKWAMLGWEAARAGGDEAASAGG